MSFTPVSWLAEKFSHLRVGGRELRSRVPTEHVPGPVLKALFWLVIILLFLDEFLILAAMFGGPIALVILVSFAIAVYYARNTERGARTTRAVHDRVTSSFMSGRDHSYRTRGNKRK